MKRFVAWLFGLPLTIIMVAFAVANRQLVTVSLDPFSQTDPSFAMNVPMWVLFYAGILVGIIAGWFCAWFGQARWRRASRKAESELSVVRSENEKLKKQGSSTDLVPVNR
jgi:uncharacterized integral membrane protein